MIEHAIPPIAKHVTEDAIESAKGLVAEVTERVRELQPSRKRRTRRRRGLLWLVVAAAGVGAVAWYVKRNRALDTGPAPDAFGAAVEAERAAGNDGQSPVATPGA